MTPDKWILEATEQQITGGLMNLILEGEVGYLFPSYTKQQQFNYHKTFGSISIAKPPAEQYIDENAFTSFLSRHFQTSYPFFPTAAPIVYQIALTHAAYPFTASPPDRLSADSLLRAITMLTGRIHPIRTGPIEQSGAGRDLDGCKFIEKILIRPARSERDVRRLIFQSIAVPAAHVDLKKQNQRVDLTDDDLADVHIVASRAQPRPNYCYKPRQWEEFLPVATRLSVPGVPLKDLQITYEALRELLKLLLAVQTFDQPAAGIGDLAALDSRAVALLRSAGSESEDVGFESFEKVYEGMGSREALLENEMMDYLHVPTPSGRLKLKPDLLQCLAKMFEVFVAPKRE
ncbi:hypothetical protein MMC17_007023 [Xylographa soralifera]|nr:hypothetical protein [Xylographa soralifera]